MCTSVVTDSDVPQVFEVDESVLDPVAPLIENCVVWDRHLSTSAEWNTGLDVPLDQCVAKPVGMVAAIRQQGLGRCQRGEQRPRADILERLPHAEEHANRRLSYSPTYGQTSG